MIKNRITIAIITMVLGSNQLLQAQDWVAPAAADNLKNPFAENSKATDKGQKIYQKLCWSCHGTTGKGDGPAAAALMPSPTNYINERVQSQSDGALFWKITNGSGLMVSYESTLTEEQRWMLVNYIRRLYKEDGLP